MSLDFVNHNTYVFSLGDPKGITPIRYGSFFVCPNCKAVLAEKREPNDLLLHESNGTQCYRCKLPINFNMRVGIKK